MPHRKIGLALLSIPVCAGIFLGAAWSVARALESDSAEEITVPAGKIFTMTLVSPLTSPLFSWVLEQGGTILETQAQALFRTVLPSAGRYDLSLTLRSSDGAEEMRHFVLLGEESVMAQRQETGLLQAVLRTRPPADAEGRIHLPVQGGILRITGEESTGTIARYALDLNSQEDADGDGIPDNDADNAFHPSLQTGEMLQVSVRPKAGETEREIQIRVTAPDHQTSDARLTILFDPALSLTPRLSMFPAAHPSDGDVQLPRTGKVLRFNAEESFGGVQRYALDLDAARDSDSDGVPSNDDDTVGSLFARDGSDLSVFFLPTQDEEGRTVTLTVFGTDGHSASLQRRIVFGEEQRVMQGPGEMSLMTDHAVLHVHESFTITVQHASAAAVNFRWDLQSDGQVDTETAVPSLLLDPDAPGILPVRVTMLDALKQEIGVVTSEFTVLVAGERSDMEIHTKVEGSSVSFEPAITRPINLLRLQPTWSFGDGETSFLLTPSHTYAASGTYTVMLSLRDPDTHKNVAEAQTTVRIEAGTMPSPHQELQEGFFSTTLRTLLALLARLFRILSFLVLLLSLPAVFLGFLGVQARRRGISLGEVLATYRDTFTGKQNLDVPLAIPTIPTVPSRVSKPPAPSIAAPVALEVRTQTVQHPAPPSSEEKVLPPWLQETKEQELPPLAAPRVASPPPQPSISSAPPPQRPPPSILSSPSSTSPTPSSAGVPASPPKPSPSPLPAPVPAWLQKGLSVQAPPLSPSPPSLPSTPSKPPLIPPPLVIPSPLSPPSTPPKPPSSSAMQAEVADDETIAIVEAEMPEKKEQAS